MRKHVHGSPINVVSAELRASVLWHINLIATNRPCGKVLRVTIQTIPIDPQTPTRHYLPCPNPLSWIDRFGLYAVVVVKGNDVTITLPIEYQGPGATANVIAKFNQGIQKYWSGKFGKYNVRTQVTQPAPNCASNNKNVIQVPYGNGRAFVNTDNRSGTWPDQRPDWTAAHEAGHLMGLPDQYTNGGGPNPGYGQDIMGVFGGVPSAQDIIDIIQANP